VFAAERLPQIVDPAEVDDIERVDRSSLGSSKGEMILVGNTAIGATFAMAA